MGLFSTGGSGGLGGTGGGGGGGGLTSPVGVSDGGTGLTSIADGKFIQGSSGAFAPISLVAGANTTLTPGSGTLTVAAVTGQFSRSATITTSDATPTTIDIMSFGSLVNMTSAMQLRLQGLRTGGASGSGAIGDAVSYKRSFRVSSISGVSAVHDVQADYTSEEDFGWDLTITPVLNTLVVQVIGAVDTDILWESTIFYSFTQG